MSLEGRLKEFGENVWDHSADLFQSSFDDRRPLAETELRLLREVVGLIRDNATDRSISRHLAQVIRVDDSLMDLLLQITGLTRNKILQDLKGRARTKGQHLKLSTHRRLVHDPPAWRQAGPYLVRHLRRVLRPLVDLEDPAAALEAMNQATWPGFIRQERAKRQGHEAEYRLATLLSCCRMPFEPQEKAENPLCRDANIAGQSFDLVVPDTRNPAICFKCTVHTANIGMYGQSKDSLEMEAALRALKGKFGEEGRPLLVTLADGVGFESNRAGLQGVLQTADEFCQFRTIWKALVVAGSVLGAPLRLGLPEEAASRHRDFLSRYGFLDRIESPESLPRAQRRAAGEAFVAV